MKLLSSRAIQRGTCLRDPELVIFLQFTLEGLTLTVYYIVSIDVQENNATVDISDGIQPDVKSEIIKEPTTTRKKQEGIDGGQYVPNIASPFVTKFVHFP